MDLIFVRILALPVILPSIIIHELAHGKMAEIMGDPTSRISGRLSFNPVAHIDWLGLLMLITFGFGWAKPVPINPYYFKDFKKGLALVGLAGPLSNFTVAWFLATVFFKILHLPEGFLATLIAIAIQLNLALAVFNLIPIPPLDGSRILAGLLPDRYLPSLMKLEQFGFLLLLMLLFMPATQEILGAVISFLFRLLI